MMDEPHALVLDRVFGRSMALKPNLESLLRCRWPQGTEYTFCFVVHVAHGVARALQYLHTHCICHGDVYAHNVLVDEVGNATLCDYGTRL